MKVNLNDKVRFVLTARGAQVVNEYPWRLSIERVTAGEETTMLLWELFEVLGPRMYNGAAALIVDNALTFEGP
jgi:hypothetical protein